MEIWAIKRLHAPPRLSFTGRRLGGAEWMQRIRISDIKGITEEEKSRCESRKSRR